MTERRLSPDDPREWLNRAHSNLSQAKGGVQFPDVYLEDLCFQAQQAAEKAMKAVLIALDVHFPYTHDLAGLLSLVEEADIVVQQEVRTAVRLSDYAVEARYPGLAEPVTHEEYEEAVLLAEHVVQWAERVVNNGGRT